MSIQNFWQVSFHGKIQHRIELFKQKSIAPPPTQELPQFFLSCRRMPHSLVQPPMCSVIWSNQPLLRDLRLLCDSLFQPHWSLACSSAHALASNHLPHLRPQPSKIYPHPHLIQYFHSQAGRSNVDLVGGGWSWATRSQGLGTQLTCKQWQ